VKPPETDKYQQYGPQTSISSSSQSSSSKVFTPPLSSTKLKKFLTVTRVANLPVITAVAPDSPAERAGLVVGDRIVAIGNQEFLGWTRPQVTKTLQTKYNAQSYLGHAELTVAKPVYAFQDERDVVIGYRQTRVRLPTKVSEPMRLPKSKVAGGDAIVHYEMLTSSSGSIFDHTTMHFDDDDVVVSSDSDSDSDDDYKVGYIRLTRFSKASTVGYLQAVETLEAAGARSYILDLRNNYGGVIQEAMLTAATLLRDPHAVMCYIMDSRAGFTPNEVEEYVVDKRFPGYLLSTEPKSVTLEQLQRETPAMFQDKNGIAWDPPSSYASLHEQVAKRGIRRVSYETNLDDPLVRQQRMAQKNVVILINEGTASAAEVFAAALHDNGRTVALVGTKSYGKGLIQHTFPMPDGGGLRLTIAEYLTPSLRHVTHVGSARFDRETGEFVGGGIRPDIFCESKQGIPGNVGADLCVGVALDALEEASVSSGSNGNENIIPGIAGESTHLIVKRMGRL
jgi:C-terminal processing protease CtpA/Prc